MCCRACNAPGLAWAACVGTGGTGGMVVGIEGGGEGGGGGGGAAAGASAAGDGTALAVAAEETELKKTGSCFVSQV